MHITPFVFVTLFEQSLPCYHSVFQVRVLIVKPINQSDEASEVGDVFWCGELGVGSHQFGVHLSAFFFDYVSGKLDDQAELVFFPG